MRLSSRPPEHNPALARLRGQWLWLALIMGAAEILCGMALLAVWERQHAWRWILVATLTLAYVMAVVWRRLPQNHHPGDDRLLPALGAANLVSIVRGGLLAFLAGFALSPAPPGWVAWAPGTLYTIAIAIDYLDGLIARLTRYPTKLGAGLDTEFDALGILVAPLVGVAHGQLPVWYLLVSTAYYLYIIGVWIRERRGQPVYSLPPSLIRRPMAGIQMGFISAVLWPVLRPPVTTITASLIMIPFVAGFIRDWLVVSGQVDAASGTYQAITRFIWRLSREFLPPILRILIAATAAWQLVGGSILPATSMSIITLIILTLLVVLGVAGRLSATLLSIVISLAASRLGLDAPRALILACAVLLMLLGTGALSLWQPEEIFLTRRYGGETRAVE
jgi:CDP-diacylglycerol--glycerol-3-phosphate 3-phosphatidyltransferase